MSKILEVNVEPIANLAAAAASNIAEHSASTSTGSSRPSLARGWVLALFKRLRAIYGAKWDEQFPDAALHDAAVVEWGIGLAGLSGEQIQRGIDRCRAELDWPPSIAGFLRLAKSGADSWEHAGPAYRVNVPALRKPKARREIVEHGLRQLRAVFGG